MYIYIYMVQVDTECSNLMKTMFPLGYYQNGFVATHALGYIMYS